MGKRETWDTITQLDQNDYLLRISANAHKTSNNLPQVTPIHVTSRPMLHVQVLEVQFRSFSIPPRWVLLLWFQHRTTLLILPTGTFKNSRTSLNGIHDRIHLRAFTRAFLAPVAQSGRWAYRIPRHLQLIVVFRGRRCSIHSVVIWISGLHHGTR